MFGEADFLLVTTTTDECRSADRVCSYLSLPLTEMTDEVIT